MRAVTWTTLTVLAGCNFKLPGNTGGNNADAPQVGDTSTPPIDGTLVDTPCADDDHDTICNTVDVCANGDDRLDGDADTIPDACDNWPCGVEPGAPSNTVVVGPGLTGMRNISLAGEADQTSAVAAATSVEFDFDFGLLYTCGQQSSCREQMEVGFAGVGRLGCIVDETHGDNLFLFVSGVTTRVTVPSTPGVYDLRIKAAFNASGCGSSDQFTGGEPGSNATVAIVCVP